MIQVLNRQLLTDYPFDDYLKLPGHSFSGIKSGGVPFKATAKMNLGTDVHSYLLKPNEYSFQNLDVVRPLALTVKQRIGPLFQYLSPELVVVADFVYNDFTLKYKGRIDLAIPGKIVIDLKVSEIDARAAIAFFKYDDQLSGYALGIDAKIILLISIHPKTKKTSVVLIEKKLDFWMYHILQKGEPIL